MNKQVIPQGSSEMQSGQSFMPTEQKDIQAGEKRSVLVVQNKMGVHARPAAMIVRTTNRYADVEVWVRKDDETVNGKSIMGLMMLAAGQGSKLEFIVSGERADALLQELETLFSRKFEES